ncbi:MAG: hypothetical protein IJE59_03705 [Clostridia bacterium]|nr:hypothetical protein [Clostridia bacterium]
MKKLTKNNGITLIALIITIIVMMILVGVTVTVALNGGLFDTTKRAAIQQEIATMQDIVSAQEAKILADKAQNGQLEALTVSAQEILSSYGVTSPEVISIAAEPAPEYVTNELIPPTGTCYKLDPSILGIEISRGQGAVEEGIAKDIFIIDSDKKIYYIREASIEVPEPPAGGEVSDALLDYILGQVNPETEVRPGRSIYEIVEFGSTGSVEGFLNVPEELGILEIRGMDPISETEVKNEAGEVIGTEGIMQIKFVQTTEEYINTYEVQVIVFVSEETQTATTSVEYGVKLVDTKEYSRIGKVVTYGEADWTVLYDDESHGLQLMFVGGYIDVSKMDINFEEVAVDLNQNGTIDQLERHLYVYNNAPDLFKKTMVSSYNDIENTFIAKDSNGNCLLRTLGSNPLISNFGEDVYRTVVVSEETFPGYGETSTWFEDNLNLEKNADGTGYVVKGTNIPFEFRTTDGITLGDSEAIEYLADYTSNSEYLDLKEESQPRRSMTFNSGSIVGGYSSYWSCSIECTFTISPDSAVADEPTKVSSGWALLLDQEKFAEFEEAAKNSSNYGDGSEDAPWDLDQYVKDTK